MCDFFNDPFGLEPEVPNAGSLGNEYMQLIKGYAKGEPTILETEQKYKPGFIDTAVSGAKRTNPDWLNLFGTNTGAASEIQAGANTVARGSDVADVTALGPGAAAAVRGVNPRASALADMLSDTASTQLAAGTQLAPGDVDRITSSVRGDWGRRGLGTSSPAELDEAVQLAVGGQNILAQREAGAQAAISTQLGLTNPALGIVTQQSNAPMLGESLTNEAAGFSSAAGPTLIPGNASYDTFNTAYNARAAAMIAGANNRGAVLGGMLSY